MKKLFLGIMLATALSASASEWKVQSFFNPTVCSSILFSNTPSGVTNLNYIAQNYLQGRYQVGTNLAGTAIYAAIATNYQFTMYTNATPVLLSGQVFPGSLVFLTNNVVPSYASTNNYILAAITTNSYGAQNLFQDVNLDNDNEMRKAPYPGSTTTNVAGILTIKVVPNNYPWTGDNTGSNIVNVVFTAVPNAVGAEEVTDAAVSAGWAGNTFTVTFTNNFPSASVYAPTVYRYPVPSANVAGCKALRCRAVYMGGTGVTTNQAALVGLTFGQWVP